MQLHSFTGAHSLEFIIPTQSVGSTKAAVPNITLLRAGKFLSAVELGEGPEAQKDRKGSEKFKVDCSQMHWS